MLYPCHLVEALDGVAPSALEDQLIPLRDEVVDGASGVGLAKGSATVHTARRLHRSLYIIMARIVDLSPVKHALERVAVRVGVAVVVDEPSRLIDVSEGAVATLYLGCVVRCVRLIPPDLVVLAHGEASLLRTCDG